MPPPHVLCMGHSAPGAALDTGFLGPSSPGEGGLMFSVLVEDRSALGRPRCHPTLSWAYTSSHPNWPEARRGKTSL